MNAQAQPDSDASLMQAFAGGEVAAFDALYARHRRGLHAYLSRLLPAGVAADDLFQETWLRVARERHRYRPQAAFGTWLYTIARNLAIDQLRRHRPLLASELEAADGDGDDDTGPLAQAPADAATQPEVQAMRREQTARLNAALAGLPAVQREAILLREQGGHSLHEIARITGVSDETAKSRLRYALNKLRRVLAPEEVALP